MPRSYTTHDALPWAAAIAGGVLLFVGYAGFDQFYLEWICLVPVLWAIRQQRPGRAFLIGWVAGIAAHGGGFYWVIQMFQGFAGMAWPLATLGFLLLAAANGIVMAAWAWGTRLIIRDTGWNVAWVSPVVWTAVEKFWPEMFPNYLGASQYKLSLLTQIADVTGILGVSFLVVYLNSTLYLLIEQWIQNRRFAWRQAAAFVVVITVVLVYGGIRIRDVDLQVSRAEKLTVGLIQANHGAGEKHRNSEAVLRDHREMSEILAGSRPLDLIVWPEGIGNLSLTSRTGRLSSDLLGNMHTPVLFGMILNEGQGNKRRVYNTALLTDGRGQILGTYDKMVLVPFGEYIPFGDTFPWLYSWSPYSSRFWPGESEEPLLFGKHPLSVSICYEDIFPGQIRSLMRGGRDGRIPDAMFNLTNDSWYGKSTEPMEHLALASFRSIEHRRSLVRATNTGVSAFVDPVGRLVNRSGLWTKETLVDRIPMMQGRTVYALLGEWLGWGCAGLSLFGLGLAIRIPKRRKERDRQQPDKGKKRPKKLRGSSNKPEKGHR
jgi:apolipoprotein N-acyltransferase